MRVKKSRWNIKRISILIAIVIAVVVAFVVYNRYFMESKVWLNSYKYFKVNENAESNEALIIENGARQEEKAIIKDGGYYLPYSYVKKNLTPRFYDDKESKSILYTTGRGTMTLFPFEKEYTADDGSRQSENNAPLIAENGKYYLDVKFVEKYVPIVATNSKEPNRVAIFAGKDGINVANAKKKEKVRYYAGIKSSIITEVSKDEMVEVLGEEGDYKKVFTKDGFTGYMKSSSLSNTYNYKPKTVDEETYTHKTESNPVYLGFVQISNANANENIENIASDIKPINVLTPTWYSFGDSKGTINDYSSATAVENIHSKGMKVWPLISDVENKVDLLEILSSKTLRRRMINRIIDDAKYLKYDGINIDFETVTVESAASYLQFIRELSVETRKNNITLSIDVYAPREHNKFYNLRELNVFADYVIVMDYDEHYPGGNKIGSISSINFVKENMEKASEYVEKSRIINALPLYTRIWGVNENGSIVSNKAVSMMTAEKIARENGATINFDESVGQNVATYKKGDVDYKIWLEDAKSLKLKFEKTKELSINNFAFWRIDYITDEVLKELN